MAFHICNLLREFLLVLVIRLLRLLRLGQCEMWRSMYGIAIETSYMLALFVAQMSGASQHRRADAG